MDWSQLKINFELEKLTNVVEIPLHSNIKYECHKASGALAVDRIMRPSVVYPCNYGFVPNTLADDGDPLDTLILTDYALHPGSIIECRVVGVLLMEDESGKDEKILCLPTEKIDPTYAHIQDINDLSDAIKAKIKNFFEIYKMLEPHKWVKVLDYQGKAEAEDFIKASVKPLALKKGHL